MWGLIQCFELPLITGHGICELDVRLITSHIIFETVPLGASSSRDVSEDITSHSLDTPPFHSAYLTSTSMRTM